MYERVNFSFVYSPRVRCVFSEFFRVGLGVKVLNKQFWILIIMFKNGFPGEVFVVALTLVLSKLK